MKTAEKSDLSAILRQPEPAARRWTRSEFYAMSELGLFEGQRVELLDGEIIVAAAKLHSHSSSTSKVGDTLRDVFGKGYWIRDQEPLRFGDRCEPEPDVSVVLGTADDFTDHPTSALLVVEVSGSSLAIDRNRKAAIYARAGIEDYWIVNVFARCVEVHRNPKKKSGKYLYESIEVIGERGTVSPLAKPKVKIVVADLLPREKLTVAK